MQVLRDRVWVNCDLANDLKFACLMLFVFFFFSFFYNRGTYVIVLLSILLEVPVSTFPVSYLINFNLGILLLQEDRGSLPNISPGHPTFDH